MDARPRGRSGTGLLLALLLLPGAGATTADAQDDDEARLRASVLLRLSEFVEWPAAVLASAPEFVVCVAGAPGVHRHLQALSEGATIHGRRAALTLVQDPEDIGHCHLLYESRGSTGDVRSIRAAANQPILTVCDDVSALEAGGMIALVRRAGRLRFDLDNAAARQAGLRFSPHLLRLAARHRGESQ
jgi:hypothetical protein